MQDFSAEALPSRDHWYVGSGERTGRGDDRGRVDRVSSICAHCEARVGLLHCYHSGAQADLGVQRRGVALQVGHHLVAR